MIIKTEKIAKTLIILALLGILIGWNFPEPAISAVTVSATVSSTMVSCTTPDTSTAFGTIDNTTVATSSPDATTTVSSSGAIYLKIYDAGDGSANPGLYKNPDLIESPNASYDATATLVAGTEGYGIQATTTGTTLVMRPKFNWVTTTDIVGGIPYGSGNATTVASSASAVSSEVVRVVHKASVNVATPGGSYSDTITYTCTTS
jgi:hypothetical protein